MGKQVVVIPVPRHMTVEQAWLEIQVYGKFVGYRRWKRRFWNPRWATIEIEVDE